MRKFLFLMAAFLLSATFAFSQTRIVTGTVTDETGNPVPNASVVVKGGTVGTTTNEQGHFSLAIPNNRNVLVISIIGMQTQEVQVSSSGTADVVLVSGESVMDEVLVTAYGTVKRSENTSSIAQVNAETIKNRPLTNVSTALDGAAPGIQLTTANGQPGSGQAIRIRGFGSINASSDPLYVLDGVPYTGPISGINMDDVETISVLKDAASTALYGSRGANGVIIITTKRGGKNRSNLSLKTALGFVQRGIPEYDLVNANQYYPLMWQAYKNSLVYRTPNAIPEADAAKIASGQYPRFTTGANAGRQNYNGAAYSDLIQLLGYNAFNVPASELVSTDGTLNPNAKLLWADDLDWNKELLRTGVRQEYLISYSGGNDKSDYYSSANYTKEQGFAIRSDLERVNGRLGVNTNPLKWFRTGLNVSASLVKSNTASDDGSTSYVNPFFFARNMGPIYPVYAHNQTSGDYILDANGDKIYDLGNMTNLGLPARGPGGSPGRHVLAETRYNELLFKRSLLSGRTYGTIYFTPWLDFTTNLGVDQSLYRGSSYENKIVGDGAPTGRIFKEDAVTTSYTWNKLLNFRKAFGVHNIEALVGHENYSLQYNYLNVRRSSQIFDGNTELVNFSVAGTNTSYTDKHTIESYLSRLNYNYDQRYFLSGSFRRDGNSRFKKEFRWDNFWSLGAAWRLDQESFIRDNVNWLSALRLRSSYGKVGNDGGIYYYAYQALYGLGYNNGNDPGVIQTNLRNDSITWETSKNFDLALEFGLFNNRINGVIEYYKRVIDGLIFSVPQPIQNGGTPDGGYSINKNIGSMYNNGIELHLDGDIIRTADLRWNLGLNVSTVKNEITKMPDGQKEIISGTKKYSVGHSIYDYWLREWMGVDPQDGAPLYRSDVYNATNSRVRANGDTVTILSNNGRYGYMGSSIPKFWGSFNTLLKYKRFELQGTFTYQVGGLIYDGAYAGIMTNGSSYGSSLHIDALKAWQKQGDITDVPRMDNANGSNNNAASSRWLIDGSFLNFRNLSVSYDIPTSILERITMRNARFFVNFENLALFNKRKGMNPQQAFSGVTSNAYVPAKITTFGINVDF